MEETGALHESIASPQYAAKEYVKSTVYQKQDRASEGDPHDQGPSGGGQHGEELAKLKGWL